MPIMRVAEELCDATRDLLVAYERLVRSHCTPEQIEKQPWRCREFVAAESILTEAERQDEARKAMNERIKPGFPLEPEPPKAEQGLGLRPDPRRERFVMEGVELTEEQIYDGLRPSQPKAEQEPIIQCPSCGCAGGNTVDRTKGLTLRCQYCGWPSQPKADAGTLEARLQDAMKFYDYNGGMVDLLRDVLTELHRRQELCLQLQQAKWESDAEARAQELRAEKAEARASSPDLRGLVENLRNKYRFMGPTRLRSVDVAAELEATLTGTGD